LESSSNSWPGYTLIEAPDLEAAKEIALTLPPGRVGSVEVRPVWERDDLVARRVPEHGTVSASPPSRGGSSNSS
jgi:hypothetical protein